MSATLLSAAVTCLVSLALGQSALRLAGAREWSWLAAPVGISVAMVIAAPALAVPGRSTTMAVLLAGLTAAGLVWCGRDPAHRPPLSGLLAGLPVLLLLLIPFLAVHRAGVLGTSFNNDMGTHMWIVEGFLSQGVVDATPLHSDYPYGPHAMVAAIAGGLGVGVDRAFAGWTMALPILTAWTALALVPRATWWRQAAVATVVGAPFLIASYYAQGAFKEVLQACLVLGAAILFAGCGPRLGLGRWTPLGLILAGSVSVYSVTGLLWPLTFAVSWLTVTVVLRVRSRGGSGLGAAARNEAPALGIGLAVLVISLLPQAGRIAEFISKNSGGPSTIPEDALGNLFGPIPVWEAFGVWANPDFRTPAPSGVESWVWTAFVVALVLAGAVWLLRRGRWMLPLAAAGSLAIWAVSETSQSPYVAAKALVIASPLLLAVAVVPLVERLPQRLPLSMRGSPGRLPGTPLSWGLAVLLIALLVFRVGVSDVRALRTIPLGPTDHAEELRSLRPTLDGRPTLYLGNDDFIRWELAGAPALAPVLGVQELPIRAQKAWSEGEPHDFDSIPPAVLDEYRWIITIRDAAGSSPLPGLRLVRTTPSFALWSRVGPVGRRSILAEGAMAGALLDCDSSTGRAVLRRGGVAAVGPRPVTAAGGFLDPGESLTVSIDLAPGSWRLQLVYVSRLPVEATGPGLRATLPPNLEHLGPRWPLGRIEVRGDEPTGLTFGVGDPFFAPDIPVAELAAIVATREVPRRVVPVRRACDRYVDWYRPSVPRGPGT